MKYSLSCIVIINLSILTEFTHGIGIGRKQSAGVEGFLLCEGKPAADVKVKLYDDDRGIDTDDLMAEVYIFLFLWNFIFMRMK